jgi:hypothetical protein
LQSSPSSDQAEKRQELLAIFSRGPRNFAEDISGIQTNSESRAREYRMVGVIFIERGDEEGQNEREA